MDEELAHCSACGAPYPAHTACIDQYYKLSEYTLTRQDPGFIHQLIVDAYAGSHAAQGTKLRTASALIGLYAVCELEYTGKQAQRLHMFLGDKMKRWPAWVSPTQKASIHVTDVLAVTAGANPDEKIRQWAKAVWSIWKSEQKQVGKLLLEDFPLDARSRIRPG